MLYYRPPHKDDSDEKRPSLRLPIPELKENEVEKKKEDEKKRENRVFIIDMN